MPVKLFSKEGIPETAVNARKRPFMTIIAIVSYYEIKKFFHFALSLHQSGSEYFFIDSVYWACAGKISSVQHISSFYIFYV